MPREFTLPDLGEGITEAQIIRVMVKNGDKISEDQSLMEVETDKAAVEIPSPFAGVASQVHVAEGDTVNVGDVIVTFDEAAGGNGEATKADKKTAPKEKKRETSDDGQRAERRESSARREQADSTSGASARRTTAPAAPIVRKLAREMGVDLDSLDGSGPGGRITREDVEAAAEGGGKAERRDPSAAKAPSAPTSRPRPQPTGSLPGIADADKWGPIRREKLTQIRKTIANQMTRSAFTAVHVAHGDEADITELDRMRRQLNEATGDDPRLTVMSFVIRATCIALRKFPILNSSFDEENGQIVYKDYINIGVAVDTERGLIVPVIRNADTLTMRGIAEALLSIADRIRSNKFEIEDLRGGTFTITNVGALGGTFSTPIINYPEIAILGLGRSRKMPAVKNDQIVPALIMPLNLSFDHRATDGANAARFTTELKSYLETPAKLLLD
jgi:pyruvate dehydrogenase E2 component (dihydrolipoamide acetyltransferase)